MEQVYMTDLVSCSKFCSSCSIIQKSRITFNHFWQQCSILWPWQLEAITGIYTVSVRGLDTLSHSMKKCIQTFDWYCMYIFFNIDDIYFSLSLCTYIQPHFTYTSKGTLNRRGNTAPSSVRSISRDSRSSTRVRAVRNTADRPREKGRRVHKKPRLLYTNNTLFDNKQI